MTEPDDLNLSRRRILNALRRGYNCADSVAEFYKLFLGDIGYNATTTTILKQLEQLKHDGRIKELPNSHTPYSKMRKYETI